MTRSQRDMHGICIRLAAMMPAATALTRPVPITQLDARDSQMYDAAA